MSSTPLPFWFSNQPINDYENSICIGTNAMITRENSICIGNNTFANNPGMNIFGDVYVNGVKQTRPVYEMIKILEDCINEKNIDMFSEYCEMCEKDYSREDRETIKRGLSNIMKSLETDENFVHIFYSLVFPHEGRHIKAAR